ncbi:hypothetical protein [Niabella hibiscisoli]|uniref:hypothetical protein n=1 Tax=Niabella hibiscisoli TaxID=1825928 RepID=UPI001F0F39E2|nr:hypothetical protein [Niabella hibiscisoli]MCH5716895.1 hypothetical protein [Niabella hibiscisoli]
MHIDKLKSFLELQIIWKDDNMFELKVTASNGRYFGITEVYDTTESLFNFSQMLINFPHENNKAFHEAGYRESYAYFSVSFYCIDNAGHIGVQVSLEDSVATEFRPEEKHKLKLEIVVEPQAIVEFQKQLSRLAIKQEGIVTLYGRDNRIEYR